MKQAIKNRLKKLFPDASLRHTAQKILLRDRQSYLHSSGWMNSLQQGKPVDCDGNPLPWMNYAVISFLQERLHSELSLFEFGSGFSTLFFATRTRKVLSLEYDHDWLLKIQAQLPDNAELRFQAEDRDGDYCRVAQSSGELFDLIIVDGRDRVNCVKQSLQALTGQGVILLDDSHRSTYSQATEIAAAEGFRALHFEGMKPTGVWLSKSTIYYRPGNCLGL